MINEEKLIKDNEKLIYSIAKRFYNMDLEDLYQAGCLGIHKAYKQYSLDSKAKFSTFAYQYIFGEMYLLAQQKALKVNRDTLRMYKLIEKTRYELAQKLNYIPNNAEIAQYLNMDIKVIDYASASGTQIMSLDSDNEDERNLYETISKTENISLDDKILLYESLKQLPKEERKIILAHYFEDLTQDKIAKQIGTSQVKVSRLEKKGMARMRELMNV